MKLKTVDLFAGAGGLSLGFEMTKMFDIVVAVENNKYAKETYKKNNDNVEIFDDIKSIDYDSLKEKYKTIDVVIGGPPCQGFSNANRQKSKLVSGNNELVKHYVKAVDKLRPNAFVMENVKMIASKSHRFFVCNNENIAELGLNSRDEHICIYKADENVREVFAIIENRHQVDQFILSEELYAYLNLINRKLLHEKKMKEYIEKKSKRISNFVKKVRGCINEEWPENYKRIVILAVEALDDYNLNGQAYEYCKKQVSKLSEIQKALEHIRELRENNVAFITKIKDSEIFVEVKTYVVMDYLKAIFRKLDYEIIAGTLNAAMFGVPQKRNRFVIIGVKKEIADKEKLKMPDSLICDEKDFLTVHDAINDLEVMGVSLVRDAEPLKKENLGNQNNFFDIIVKDSTLINNHFSTDTTEEALERYKALKQGQNFHNLEVDLKGSYSDPSRTQNTIYKRLKYLEPSDTVLNARKSMWIHPIKDRAISVREVARLQSFPDTYKFYGTKDSQYQQVGNAVPPILARAIAEKVLDLLNKSPEEKLEDIYKKFKMKR